MLPQLAPAKGLALRLELLMLFRRAVSLQTGTAGSPWPYRRSRSRQDLGELAGPGAHRLDLPLPGGTFVGARQIRDALRILDGKHHLVRTGKDNSRHRRDYDKLTLLPEASTPT